MKAPEDTRESILVTQPSLTTDRLLLRPFVATDAPSVQRLAGEREIAYNTESIPHPYPEGHAAEWISTLGDKFADGRGAVFAITLGGTGELVGAVGLDAERAHQRAQLGYWIGKAYWGHGYATEAARAVVRFGFEQFGLRRIHAMSFARNPASCRVLEKIGMQREGCLRSHFKKWDELVDAVVYGLLATDDVAAATRDGEG